MTTPTVPFNDNSERHTNGPWVPDYQYWDDWNGMVLLDPDELDVLRLNKNPLPPSRLESETDLS